MIVCSVISFEQWRNAARPMLAAGVAPETIEWCDARALGLPAGSPGDARAGGQKKAPAGTSPLSSQTPHGPATRISAALLRLLTSISMYRHAGRWELMYRLAWRSVTVNPHLLDDAADADVRNASLMEKAVNRDVHKMHAFVRFRDVSDSSGEKAFFAWFEPQHEILRRGAAFFVKRFANMQWTIATPDGAAVWDSHKLCFIDSPEVARLPSETILPGDSYERLWRTYYRSICNVARINPAAMQREMPQRYWKHLPEAAEISSLIRDGMSNFVKQQRESPREGIMMTRAVKRSLPPPILGEGPQTCRRCDLWQHATQAVSGEGAPRAQIMLVGEQPGDEEDLRGHPFVGPAGKLLDELVAAAGVERTDVFITNAVKHFKWEPRGKRRLHEKPGIGEITACNIWLEQEIAAVKPLVIVALGATALRSLTGSTWSIERARQQELRHSSGARILSTYHPSAILRAEGGRIEELRTHVVNDLRMAARLASQGSP